MLVSGGEKANLGMIVIPFYLVGMFYAAKILMKLLGVVAKIYFSYQFMSLLINPLWGTVICLILLVLGVSAILIFGWLIGIGRCIYGLIAVYQIDQQCIIDRNR